MIAQIFNKTALITGATGFVGSHLSRRLVRDGWQIHILARNDSDINQLKEVINNVVVGMLILNGLDFIGSTITISFGNKK